MRHALALCSLLALFAGCGSPTELMLVVKAGPGLTIGDGGAIDEVRVRAQPASDPPTTFFFDKYVDLCTTPGQSGCRPQAFASADYDGALTLPIHFLLEPGDQGLNEDIRVWVDALSEGKTVLASGLRFRFSKGHRLWLELPLFTQCLGKVSCQEQDLACGYDTDCVAYTPTTTDSSDDNGASPVADLAGADLTLLPDLALASDDMPVVCGGGGLACCGTPPNASCNNGLTCVQSSNVCLDTGVGCGDTGQGCCGGDGGAPFCNSNSLVCNGGICTECGAAAGELCCTTGTACTAGTQCNSNTGKCECGNESDPCCNGKTCNTSQLLCDEASQSCKSCGGQGQTCCAGNTCNEPSAFVCSSGQCTSCGPGGLCCNGAGTASYGGPVSLNMGCVNGT